MCSVHVGDGKRAQQASAHKILKQHTAASEIGVCVGTNPIFPGAYLFYIDSTRQIVPRRVIKILKDIIPFGWQVKKSMFRTLQQFPINFEDPVLPNTAVQNVPQAVLPQPSSTVIDSTVNMLPTLAQRYVLNHLPPSAPVLLPTPPVVSDVMRPITVSVSAPIVSTPSVPVSAPVPTVFNPPLSAPPVVVSASVSAPIVSVPVPSFEPRRSQRSTRGQAAPVFDPSGFVAEELSFNFLTKPHGYPVKIHSPVAPVLRVRQRKWNMSKVVSPAPAVCKDSVVEDAACAFLVNCAILQNSERIHVASSAPSWERVTDVHGLGPDLLSTVSFLSEVPSHIIPPGLCKPKTGLHEVQYAFAVKHPEVFDPGQLAASLEKELNKMTTGMGVLEVVTDAAKQVDANALFLPAMILSKQKYLTNGDKDCISSRFAIMGNLQDPAMCGDTYAATADDATMVCCMAAFQAHAVQHNYVKDLEYESFDVCGAFLHVDIQSPVMIITRIPAFLKHPLAGKLCIVRKSCYGLRQSNKAFADDFAKTIRSAGFMATTDPCVYKKVVLVPDAPAHRCYIGTHVDDGKAMFNHRPLYDHLISVLERRYGILKKAPLSGFTGTTFKLHANGAFTRSQDGYIMRFLESVNVKGIAIAKAPSSSDLFATDVTSPLCDQALYKSLIGSLIHTLRTRYDIQKEVVHLASKSALPTQADLAKVVLVMRYLAGTPRAGPTYFTKQGPVLKCLVDCSYGVHYDGRCHYGFSMHIGDDSAPFFVCSKKQTECVALGSMEGEYVALSSATRKVMEFRYFLESIDFPQNEPTTIFEDNMSAINLAKAPAVTKRSRHIHIRHHYVRDCVAQDFVVIKYLSTDRMLADLFTKPFGPKKFRVFKEQLFNSASLPPVISQL